MCTSISIRSALENDAEAIARLAGDLGYPVEADLMRIRVQAMLTSATDLLLVAVDSSKGVVGWLQAHAALIIESGFRVEITGVIVSPVFRRRAVGRSLVAKAEDWAETISAETVVVRSNAKTHSFYLALRYTSIKTQMVYQKTLVDVSSKARGCAKTLNASAAHGAKMR